MATAARNLPISSRQNVVLTHDQFPADYYAWERLTASSGAELRVVRAPDRGPRGHGWNQRLLEAIDSKTAIVSVPNVHWMDGTLFDLLEIGRRCRDVGAALVVDGTQSVGALPFDVEQLEPDVVISAAYKWLLGPYSLSLAYYGPRFDEGTPLEETWTARKGSRDFENLTSYSDEYAPGAARYDVSERANFLLAPIAQRSIELLLDWRPRRIQDYCRRLTGDFLSRISAMGCLVEDEPWRASHLFGVRIPQAIDPKVLRDTLRQRQVHVSVRGSSLRVSPNVYNQASDLDPLEEVLREAVR